MWQYLRTLRYKCHIVATHIFLENFLIGTVSRDGYFLKVLNILISTFCVMMVFLLFQSFSLPYTMINFLFASLKLLTNFENSSWNPPRNSFFCDWSMFSCADLLLAGGKICKNALVTGSFRYDFTESQVAFSISKLVSNFKGAS